MIKNELEPVHCGCGGEAEIFHIAPDEGCKGSYCVRCSECLIQTPFFKDKEKAIMVWNRAMGTTEDFSVVERTAKVVERNSMLPNNQIHLCEYCKYDYPECPAVKDNVIFGNGIGYDNICACVKFEIKPERIVTETKRMAKVQILPRRSETSMSWEGKCSNCGAYTIHEMNYCFECGARLEWE